MLQMIQDIQKMIADFIKNQSRKDDYTQADICGCRATDASQQKEINTNTEDITINSEAIAETYENIDDTNGDVSVCLEAIAELYEMIGE